MSIDVSVVVVSWNTRDDLARSLDALEVAHDGLALDVVVVDNGSTDGSVEMLRQRAGLRLIELGDNTGFTHAANVGAQAATGEHLLFLNPDVLVPPGTLPALVAALRTRPDAWAATPWFRNADGTPQHFWRRLPGLDAVAFCFTRYGRRLDRLTGGRARKRRMYAELPDPPGLCEIEGVGAACLLVRTAEFRAAGGFDERFFNFFQDGAIERAMHAAGRPLLGVGDVEVVHAVGVSFRALPAWEVDGQFLHALRQYYAGEAWWRRLVAEALIRLDLLLPGPDRALRRRRALRPLDSAT